MGKNRPRVLSYHLSLPKVHTSSVPGYLPESASRKLGLQHFEFL